MLWGRAALALALLLLASGARAHGPSPYLPLALDPELERAVERLLVLAGEPVLARPIPTATVLGALPRACRFDPALCERVRSWLARLEARAALTHASASAGGSSEGWPLPNRHGLGAADAWQSAARLELRPLDHALVSLGFVAQEGDATPSGSLLSVGESALQLDFGWRTHSLSPFTDGAMLISANAPAMPSLTLSNYRPLSRLGLRYAVFVARMSESDEIEFRGERVSGHPRLAGVHLSIAPVPGWSLGVNRLEQYGGGPRDDSLGKLVRAFFDPEAYDNESSSLPFSDQFGNQLASLTTRFVFPGRFPFAIYAEYAGEDTSRRRNYLLGNSSLSLGIDFPRLGERCDLTYELSEWQNGWYTNGVYGDGLVNHGRVIGHWGGDQRVRGDDVGAQSHSLRLGITPALGGSLELRYRTLANESYSAPDYTRLHAVSLRYSRVFRALRIGAEIQGGRDTRGERFARFEASVQHAPPESAENATGPAPQAREEQRRPPGAEIFVDAGASAGRAWIDLDPTIPKSTTSFEASPHFAIGVRRAVSQRQDLGFRLELDVVDGDLLLGARALDYRLRLGRRLALSAFLGAARYDLATPAYGLYGGLGTQWRNLRPGWDLGFDAKYALEVARDHLVASDPPGATRSDSFHDLLVLSAYLSRSF